MQHFINKKSIRKWHRYLGLFLGIQFLLWTLGGLYFSWTRIEQVRGDDLKQPPLPLFLDSAIISPADAIAELPEVQRSNLEQCQLIRLPNGLCYQILYKKGNEQSVYLIDAFTGKRRAALSKDEAVQLALEKAGQSNEVKNVRYLTATGEHHEYRSKPLPVWAIEFGEPTNTTVYVSSEWGTVQSFRNNSWRIFDFLWMLHTMDYEGRDNFNNWVLRIVSVLGLLTVFSGFALFFVSRKRRTNKSITD